MCGRYNLRASDRELEEFFRVVWPPQVEWTPRYNIAPTQTVLAVRLKGDHNSKRELAPFRWGLIPSWSKDEKIGNRLINARADTVAEKPSFRAAYKRRRCLIPATGFYEWKKAEKQPFHIHRKDDGLFCFAGLWERWEKGDQPIDSCTILTTDANNLLQPIHDRMPVIMPRELADLWLDPDVEPGALAKLLQPYPGEDLQADPVSALVNNPRNESPECVTPI
jgi:putative SOS response-associated peptidase YedK